jgi:hypothetical protein
MRRRVIGIQGNLQFSGSVDRIHPGKYSANIAPFRLKVPAVSNGKRSVIALPAGSKGWIRRSNIRSGNELTDGLWPVAVSHEFSASGRSRCLCSHWPCGMPTLFAHNGSVPRRRLSLASNLRMQIAEITSVENRMMRGDQAYRPDGTLS